MSVFLKNDITWKRSYMSRKFNSLFMLSPRVAFSEKLHYLETVVYVEDNSSKLHSLVMLIPRVTFLQILRYLHGNCHICSNTHILICSRIIMLLPHIAWKQVHAHVHSNVCRTQIYDTAVILHIASSIWRCDYRTLQLHYNWHAYDTHSIILYCNSLCHAMSANTVVTLELSLSK